jgi:hypothetical protein
MSDLIDEALGYSFGPRPRAGVIATLSPRHLAIAVTGGVVAWLLVSVFGALLPGVLLALVVAALVLVPTGKPGEKLGDAAALWGGVLWRALRGTDQCQSKTDPTEGWVDVRLGNETWGVRSLGPASGEVWLRVVRAPEFALRSSATQDAVLDRWGRWLDSLAREKSPVREVTWLEVASPSPGGGPAAWAREHARPLSDEAHRDYLGLLDGLAASSTEHVVLVRLTVEPSTTRPDLPTAVAAAAAATCRSLEPFAVVPLSKADYAWLVSRWLVFGAAIEQAVAEAAGREAPPPRPVPPWKECDGGLRVGTSYARVWWACELPRQAVRADFLAPLLATSVPATRLVWTTLRPVSPWRAERRAEAARTQLEAERASRARQGYVPKASELREAAAVEQRLAELLSGHALLRHSTHVAVVAPTRAAATAASDAVLAAAGASGVQLTACVPDARATLATLFPWWGTRMSRLRQLLGGRVHSEHEDSTRHARALYPAQAGAAFPAQGVAIGRDVVSGEVAALDPWEWYRQGLTTSPSIFVLGEVGRGKSALVKALLTRSGGVFGRAVYVLDPKGEYAPLAAALNLPSVRLEPGGTTRLNPLELAPGERPRDLAARRAGVSGALAAIGLRRDLGPHEEAALFEASARLSEDATLGDLVTSLLSPAPDLAAALATTPDRLADDVRGVALALRNLSAGRLSGMLDGEGTVSLHGATGLHLDLSPCYSDRSILAPVMAASLAWLAPRLAGPGQKFLLADEVWALLQDQPGLATWLASTVKLARSLGVSSIFVAHRVSDLAAAGESASVAAKRAEGLLSDTQVRIVFSQAPGELPTLATALGLDTDELEIVRHLPRGRCLVVVGDRRALWDVTLTEREKSITDTDAAMRATAPAPN